MSNSKVVVEKHEGLTRVTMHEEGEWSLLMSDINEACIHVRCFGSMSYVYEDDDGFTYSVRPSPVRRLSLANSTLVELRKMYNKDV